MTERERNLLIAARWIRRCADAFAGDLLIEGVPALDIASDIDGALIAARAQFMLDAGAGSVRVPEIPERFSTEPFRLIPGGTA